MPIPRQLTRHPIPRQVNRTLTHVRIDNETNPYYGQGFSIISYVAEFGSGEGWTYDKAVSSNRAELNGMFTKPLIGIVSATLDETESSRTLFLMIERIDLGLPPAADLIVKIVGPERVSPGQTVDYVIEYRNDGLKSAENITLLYFPPFLSDFVSVSLPGSYDGVTHIVRWDFENVPPATRKYLNIEVRIFWELPEGAMLSYSASVYPKETADDILRHASPWLTEKYKMIQDMIATLSTSALPDKYGVPLSIAYSFVSFLGEQPLDPVIIECGVLRNTAAVDLNFEKAQYYSDVIALLHALENDPDYLKNKGTTILQALEETAQNSGYTPPRCTITITTGKDPNAKYGPEGYVSPGQELDYKVEYENEGEGIAFGVYFTDTLDEDLNASTLEIGPVFSTLDGSIIADAGTYNPSTRTITWLVGEVGPGEGGYANFSAQVKNDAPEYAEIINYATVYFPSVPETTPTNAIVSVVGQPDIAVTDITASESAIAEGSTLSIDVTVANKGYYPETFNLTLYVDTTAIQTENITLLGGNSATIVFLWNTTGFAKGNYTISAYAWPVSGEIDTTDNLYAGGLIQVTIPGDINTDGIVDIFDIVIVALEFGHPPPPIVDLRADVNKDGLVDIFDIVVVALHFGETG
jgi:uncharacterized repeat protein (TIGR01451 family)